MAFNPHPGHGDHKTILNRFCQKYCAKAIGKGEVVYTTQRCQGTDMYQAVVKLNCIDDGPEFAGELAGSKKEAEQNAAAQALDAYADEVEKLNSQVKKKKRKSHEIETATDLSELPMHKLLKVQESISKASHKSLFIEFCTKVLGRLMAKDDFTFMVLCDDLGANRKYTCTLSCPSLPEPFTSDEWQGETCSSIKAAEHSAALAALNAMKDHEDIEPKYKEAGMKINLKLQALEAAQSGQALPLAAAASSVGAQ
eukprot:TRINITY_DN8564_c0_g1_i2.p1 TRINITY_DN8564_c0_g1~~TRINITY_DN8564_c0_g1_i2.p1  ORF type:complete len:254 (-),score=71.25 TRINITY_DN8564_c0_g1_i2:246-1007(-)